MSLKEKLDANMAEFKRKTPPEMAEPLLRALKEAAEAGYEEKALGVGDKAPVFELPDAEGNVVSSADLLKSGPLVVSFYRGFWCSFCNLELKALEEFSGEIIERGARIVAISPQSAANSRRTGRDCGVTFPILIDRGCEVTAQFGLLYTPPDYVQKIYRSNGVDLSKVNAAPDWNIPVPGRYLIGQDGVIRYAEVNPDYSNRPEPEDLREPLDLCSA